MAMDFNASERERDELNWLLTSGVLGRSQNFAKMLKFICEKHFEGQANHITEHALAVEALGRRPDFNPHVDTIVRVTAHQLRKRLQEIYTGQGASHAVHVHIPNGQYAPSFVYRSEETAGLTAANAGGESPVLEPVVGAPVKGNTSLRKWLIPGLVLIGIAVAGALLRVAYLSRAHFGSGATSDRGAAAVVKGRPVRALMGTGRAPYVDRSGNTWAPGNFCTGGSNLEESNQRIAGTDDPLIFLGGIRGHAHCVFPVDPGIYEVHLLFAEASDLPEATDRSVFSINGGDNISLDVVDDAGGDYIADTKVFRNVRPENDGTIHIDYVGEVSAMKAVEILPAPSEELLPIRIVAGPSGYKDPQGNLWLPDRYVIGGRHTLGSKENKSENSGMYSSHRVGNFRYILPVVPRENYRVRLYFKEPWFGKENAGSGGPGSRVFDVWSNGVTLLKNFDIIKEGGSNPVVKTFEHIQATEQGKIDLFFSPVNNYPLISAIEVQQEPTR